MPVTNKEKEPASIKALREWWTNQSDEQLIAIYRDLENNAEYELIPEDPDVWLRVAYLDNKNQCMSPKPSVGQTVGPIYINIADCESPYPVKAMNEALEWSIIDIYKRLRAGRKEHIMLALRGFILFDDVNYVANSHPIE